MHLCLARYPRPRIRQPAARLPTYQYGWLDAVDNIMAEKSRQRIAHVATPPAGSVLREYRPAAALTLTAPARVEADSRC